MDRGIIMTPVDSEVAALSLASWLRWRNLINLKQQDTFCVALKEAIEQWGYEIAEQDEPITED
jgi:hypothetical protein